ncbi:MAG TPA: dihydroxyacetone kinase, partial [Pseudonocardiaceae bacterium]|nr:dihydroxyacetone kinase [Pseudonocardiaceae bacterium]
SGPAYEVMYLLEAPSDVVGQLRDRLAALGDSVLVVGGDRLWNVHVHVDDVGAAIEAGIEAGRPYRVRVTHFAEQVRHHQADQRSAARGRGVVAFAAGPGLLGLFRDAGAVAVSSSAGVRSSTGDVLAVIRSTGCAEIIVLPNDKDILASAEVAAHSAREAGIRATVIPTRTQLQGLAAIAVHDGNRSFDDDVVAMTSAAGHIRQGAVTVAARDAMTMAGPCRAGDSLGVVEGDFAVIAGELSEAATQVIERLLSGGGELVTLVKGEHCDDELVRRVTSWVAGHRADVEVSVYDGAQARYPLLIGVE